MNAALHQFDSSFLLAMKYQSPVVPLEVIVKDFLPHLKIETAKKRAAVQDLPFPTFKAEDSNKAPYMVNIADVALWLNKQSQISKQDWTNMHA